jgi:transaldolase
MSDQNTSGAIAERTAAPDLAGIRTKIFADGADIQSIVDLLDNPLVTGFTTNPTLMRKAGVSDYEAFARELLERVPDHPISLEVFADDEAEVIRQARLIASWGENVYVKIPVTTTTGVSLAPAAKSLAEDGVQINVTALMTPQQVETIATAVAEGAPSFISLFAGRIADAGIDPVPLVKRSVEIIEAGAPHSELIWASPREVLNLIQADECGCHIITMTHDLLAKLKTVGKDLDQFSLETVQMFHSDAVSAGFEL